MNLTDPKIAEARDRLRRLTEQRPPVILYADDVAALTLVLDAFTVADALLEAGGLKQPADAE